MSASRPLDLLRTMDIFKHLPDQDLAKVARLLKEHKFAENQVIFLQGGPGDSLYIVTHGRVRISTSDSFGREKVLAFYGPGEFFGDMAVLTGAERSATAVASTDVRVLQLRKDDFDVLLASNIEIMKSMLRIMVDRQTAMNTRISQEAGASAGDVHGLITVVFSPRGGAGQTMLATNLAVALAESTPDRVVVLDLDLLFGHVAMLLDVVPRTSLAAITPAAIRSLDRESFAYYLAKHDDSSLRLMVGTARPEESELVTGDHVRAILEMLRRQFVHVVVDAGSRFSEPCLAAIESADQVLIVGTPEPAVLTDVSECLRVLRDLLAVPGERVQVVLNHPSPYGGVSPAEAANSLNLASVDDIPYGGDEVTRCGLEGSPLVMKRAGNPVSKAIATIARRLDRSAQEAVALAR